MGLGDAGGGAVTEASPPVWADHYEGGGGEPGGGVPTGGRHQPGCWLYVHCRSGGGLTSDGRITQKTTRAETLAAWSPQTPPAAGLPVGAAAFCRCAQEGAQRRKWPPPAPQPVDKRAPVSNSDSGQQHTREGCSQPRKGQKPATHCGSCVESAGWGGGCVALNDSLHWPAANRCLPCLFRASSQREPRYANGVGTELPPQTDESWLAVALPGGWGGRRCQPTDAGCLVQEGHPEARPSPAGRCRRPASGAPDQ